MTRDEVGKLEVHDRVKDTRDGEKATVLFVDDNILRIRYDDCLLSNYIATEGCGHLELEKETK